MKRILETLKENWPAYFFEIIVITLGILGAFALNNSKDRSNTKRQVYQSLSNLYIELQDDSVQFSFQQKNSEQTLINIRKLLTLVADPTTSIDSMEEHYHSSRSFILYVPQNSSFESMNQLGLLQNVNDPDLLYQIQNYYTFIQPNVKILRDFEERRFQETMNSIDTDPAIIMESAGWDDLPLDYEKVREILKEPKNFSKVYKYGKTQEFLISRSEGYVTINRQLLANLRIYLKSN